MYKNTDTAFAISVYLKYCWREGKTFHQQAQRYLLFSLRFVLAVPLYIYQHGITSFRYFIKFCIFFVLFCFLTGKNQKALSDLLREHNLPPGLFPRNITCYEFDESKGKLTVHLSSPCEVCFKDSSIVRYANRVKGTLSKGKLTIIEGMKTKVLVWVKVSSVHVESYKSDKIWFTTAGVKKSRPKDAYEMSREAIKVQEFWALWTYDMHI